MSQFGSYQRGGSDGRGHQRGGSSGRGYQRGGSSGRGRTQERKGRNVERILEWSFHSTRIPSEIYTILTRNSSYRVEPDPQKKYRSNGELFFPPKSDDYTEVSIEALSDGRYTLPLTFSENLHARAVNSKVNGHTTDDTSNVESTVSVLSSECQLKWYLQDKGHRLADQAIFPNEPNYPVDSESPTILVRLAQSYQDSISLENANVVMVGETHTLTDLTKQLTASLHSSSEDSAVKLDQGHGFIAISLDFLMNNPTTESLKEELIRLVQENEQLRECLSKSWTTPIQYSVGNHLSSFISNISKPDSPYRKEDFLPAEQSYMPWHGNASFDCVLPSAATSLLVTVWNWPDLVQFDLTGGKRCLGETPLDCAVRETFEETKIDLKAARVRREGSSAIEVSHTEHDDIPWHLTLRLKNRGATTCSYIFLHESIFAT